MLLRVFRAFLSLVNDTNKRESGTGNAVEWVDGIIDIVSAIFEGLSGLFDIFTFL
jgi:hypothetical protein